MKSAKLGSHAWLSARKRNATLKVLPDWQKPRRWYMGLGSSASEFAAIVIVHGMQVLCKLLPVTRSRRQGQVLRFSDEITRERGFTGEAKMRQAFAWAFSGVFRRLLPLTFQPKARPPDPTTTT